MCSVCVQKIPNNAQLVQMPYSVVFIEIAYPSIACISLSYPRLPKSAQKDGGHLSVAEEPVVKFPEASSALAPPLCPQARFRSDNVHGAIPVVTS